MLCMRKVFNSADWRLLRQGMITIITKTYLSMSWHYRSIIRACCLARCNYHSFGGNLPMTLCQLSLQRYFSTSTCNASASVTDSIWLLCNFVNLASLCSTQRHEFELLCEPSALVSVETKEAFIQQHPAGSISYIYPLHTYTHIRLEAFVFYTQTYIHFGPCMAHTYT